MKKTFLLFSSCLAFSGMIAQKTANTAEGMMVLPAQVEAATLLCDTIANLDLTSDTAVVYSNSGTGNWGYVSGHNSYKDAAKAEKFSGADYTTGYQLAGGIFYFYKAAGDSGVSTISLAAWEDDGANGYPSSLLGTTAFVISNLQTGTTANMLMFQNPVTVSGDFYLGLNGFQYSSPQKDTVALYTGTKLTNTNTAYEQWIDQSWHAFSEVNNWNFKLNFFMAAVLCNTEVGTYELLNPSEELIVFPNPSSGDIYLNPGKTFSGTATIEIYDLSGRKVSFTERNFTENSTAAISPELQNGVYTLHFRTTNQSIIRTIVLNR